jgi:hypothetical protein
MKQFMLEIASYVGAVEEYHQYLIRAPDEERVKEWFRYSLEEQGYSEPHWSDDKLILENTEHGRALQFAKARELTMEEFDTMEGYISKWYKPLDPPFEV